MGETRVDLLHLLEDLRDAYPGATEETILTEIVANSLDSGAAKISITTDPVQRTLTIVDDGRGMRRRELARYHDIAASSKVRGAGIGFAGVGVKIALLLSEEVITETRSGKQHVATVWHLASRHRAPWKWIPPPGLTGIRGTAIRLQLSNALSPLLDGGFVDNAVRRDFQPLFDPALAGILSVAYPGGVQIGVNGVSLSPSGWQGLETAAIAVRMGRRRKPAAVGYMIREPFPLAEDRQGIAVSTFGKVIRRGWEWLGVAPATPQYVGGLVEVPALADCLTLNKSDFLRTGPRGAVYLAYRKAIQEAVARQLEAWGNAVAAGERARRRAARPVERDLEGVLMDLAADFPLLASLVDQRSGGQRRLPMAGRNGQSASAADLVAAPGPLVAIEAGASSTLPSDVPPSVREPAPPAPSSASAPEPMPRSVRRPSRYGLTIQFEHRPEDLELARLVESTVWVNEAHPAYGRAVASRSEGYHVALAAAMALAPLAVEPAKEHGFVTAFLTSWGEALHRRKGRRQR